MVEKLKSIWNFINSNFIFMSKKNKVKFIVCTFLFLYFLSYTVNTYTNILNRVENMKVYKEVKSVIVQLNDIPYLVICILVALLFFIIYLLRFAPKTVLPLQLIRIVIYNKPDISSNIFEITLANPTNQQIILKELRAKWKYYKGSCCSIGQGVCINSVADYIVDIPLDVTDENIQTRNINMSPIIVVPPRDNSGPSFTQFKVQFHYYFSGSLDWHPCSDWDILYSLDILDHKNASFNIFSNYNWRTKEEINAFYDGTIEEYDESLRKNFG